MCTNYVSKEDIKNNILSNLENNTIVTEGSDSDCENKSAHATEYIQELMKRDV